MWWLLLFSLLVNLCFGNIYYLNETEYDRLPPLFQLDEYPKCLRSNDTYCLVKLELFADPHNDLMTIIQEYSRYSSKRYNYSTIDRGVCVKRHCRNFVGNRKIENKEGLERILEVCLNESIFKEYGLQAKISETYCDRQDDEKNTDPYQTICKVFFIGILLMNIVGSLYDVFLKKNDSEKNSYSGDPYMQSFSISRNWKDFTTPVGKLSRVYQLRFLNGTRCLLTVLVISAHMLLTILSYIDNPHDVEKYYDDAVMIRILVSGSSVLQIYLILSGFLLGYLHQVEEEKKGAAANNNLTRKIWLRWMRLTPLYAMCLAFICTQLVHFGSGPLWTSNVREWIVKDCRHYWWLHLLYLNSYVPDDRHCMVQTWQIGTDTLLHVVGLVVLVKVPTRWRLKAVLLTMVAGMLMPPAVIWWNDLNARVMMNPEMHRTFRSDATYDLVYKPAHTNLLSFSFGLLASILCHRLEKIKYNIHQHKFLSPYTAVLIPGILLLFTSGLRYYDLQSPAPLIERALYTTLLHSVVGCLMVVVLVGGALGFKSTVLTFMRWDIWSVFAKLSYGMYLVHFDLMRIIVARRTTLGHASYFMFAINLMGVYGVSCVISLLLHLTVEAPFDKVVKTYYKRKDQVEKAKEE